MLVYSDGTDFSNEDGPWESAPSDGIQLLMTWDPFWGRRCYTEKDHYIVTKDGEPYGTDDLGPWLRSLGIVKYGLMMRVDAYKDIVEKAKQENP